MPERLAHLRICEICTREMVLDRMPRAVRGARQLALNAVQPQTNKVRVGDIVLMAGLVWQNDAGASDRSNCKRFSRASRWAGPTDAARVGRLLLDVAKA